MKSIREQKWPCHKKCQVQPRVIICIDFVETESPMLYTCIQSFKVIRLLQLGPKKAIFKRFYHIWAWRPPWSHDLIPLTHRGSIWNFTSMTKCTNFQFINYNSFCKHLHILFNHLIDNIFVEFGGRIFQQTIGIPMVATCAPLLADLFEADFVESH